MKRNIWLIGAIAMFLVSACIQMPHNIDNPTNLRVPPNFNWKTIKELDVVVNVSAVSEQSANRAHVIKIHSTPLLNSSSLIASGIARPGTPYRVKLSVAAPVEKFYIHQVAPDGTAKVTVAEVTSSLVNVSLSEGSSPILTKGGAFVKAAASFTSPDIEVPSQFDVTINNNNTLALLGDVSSYGNPYYSYLIPAGFTRTGSLSGNYKAEHAVLFVAGTLNLSSTTLKLDKTSIVVLPGGKVIVQNLNASYMGTNPPVIFVIKEGGELVINSKFGIDQYDISNFGTMSVGGNFSLTNGATLYNEGTLVSNSLGTSFEITNNSQLFNAGELTLEHLRVNSNTSFINDTEGIITTTNYTQSNGTVANNHGELSVSAKLGATSGAILNNHCLVTANESALSGFNITLESGSIWLTQLLKLNSTNIEMKGGSMLMSEDIASGVWNGVITSTSSEWSLLKTTGDVADLRWTGTTKVDGNIEWVHEKLAAGSGTNGIDLYQSVVTGGAVITNEQTINIVGNSCNKNLGQIEGEEPLEPEEPFASVIYFPSESGWATYAFEDNWPSKGDYDLNDLVLKFRVTQNLNSSNQATDLIFDYQVVSVGAVYKIAPAFQLDNVLAENVASVEREPLEGIESDAFTVLANGTEPGVDLAIIPIINNAKRVVVHSCEYLNTDTEEPFIFTPYQTIKVNFVNPVPQEDLTMDNFNFFISVNVRGREIHLPGYQPTAKFDPSIAIGGDLHPSDIYKNKDGLMWGLMIPMKFDYPIEMKNITMVYLKFVPWANSSGAEYSDWYEDKDGYRNKSYIYSQNPEQDEGIM